MEVIDNANIKIWIKNDIMYCIYKSKDMTLPIAMSNVKLRLDYCMGKTYPLIGNVSLVKSVTSEARKYLSTGESQKFLSAGAFLVKNPVAKHLINFWLQIDRPKLPAKFFTNESDALKWLENIKSINSSN